jgi:hypothetical protein
VTNVDNLIHDAWQNTAWPYDPRRPDLVTELTDGDRTDGLALRCRELVDSRLTDPTTVTNKLVRLIGNRFDVRVEVARKSDGNPGRFKATYVVWWEQGASIDACVAFEVSLGHCQYSQL